jgi:hypothetical protein
MYYLCLRLHAIVLRYIYAGREVGFISTRGTKGYNLEAKRDWKYVAENGLDSIFHGYAISLDMYVRFCWSELGKMGSLMIGLLVAEVGGARVWRCTLTHILKLRLVALKLLGACTELALPLYP